MPYEFIDLGIDNRIATVALNRVEKYNALNPVLARNLTACVRDLSLNDEVRVIVLKSNAKIFCAGIDLEAVAERDKSNPVKSAFVKDAYYSLACCNVLEECKKPVIGPIHGKCVGAGLDMACACDIRVCTEDAQFALREAGMGLVADMGILQRLPLIIGQGYAREMAFTARFYGAREVEKMGLVNAVYPDFASMMVGARKLAAVIAENAPIAVEETKDALNFSRQASIADGMAYAKQKNAILFPSEDMREAAAAFREKRKPQFKGR